MSLLRRSSLPLITITTLLLASCASDNSSSAAFQPITADFEHQWNDENSFPFSGGAAIDIDSDGTMELFVSGGDQQHDALFSYQDGQMVDIIAQTGINNTAASYGPTAIDVNNDGQTDLIVAREDGVWLYLNNNGQFNESLLAEVPDGDTILGVAAADIDLDGDFDLYLSHFINYEQWRSAVFNDPNHIRYNRLLLNEGDLQFTDITETSGTQGTQNTFLSAFVDLDNDGYQDLIVSNNTGQIEIFHNLRDNTFDLNSYQSGFGFWMGIGVGDYDKDGDQDLAFSNAGDSIPDSFLTGDLTDEQRLNPQWAFLRNDDGTIFFDITQQVGLFDQGFGWGIVLDDLNLDGELDLLAAQNYVKWPVHKVFPLPGLTMTQRIDGDTRIFKETKTLNLENSHYGQSPIIGDFNGDTKQDVAWINMAGPISVSLNTSTEDVVTLAVPENAQWQGANITLVTENGQSYTRQVNQTIGMLTDQSPHISFAVSATDPVKAVNITFANKETISIPKPEYNSLIML